MKYNEQKEMADAISQKYKDLFTGTLGQQVLEDLKKVSGLEKKISAYTVNGEIDVNRTLVNEGARHMVIYILEQINKKLK